MSPSEFIAAAYAAVKTYTDSADGTQMHRRAATGRRIVPFVHATGVVTARLEGQYVDVGEPWQGDDHPHAPGRNAGDEFARLVNAELVGMAPPIPGKIYAPPAKRGGSRPAVRADDARRAAAGEVRVAVPLRLPDSLASVVRLAANARGMSLTEAGEEAFRDWLSKQPKS